MKTGKAMTTTGNTIKYTADSGYTGIFYGESSYAVFDPNGNEVMHTGSRNINTYEELVRSVDSFPEKHKHLEKLFKDAFDGEDEYEIPDI